MSKRVEQQQQKRMDAERMQKAADKQARQGAADQTDRQQFGQLLNKSNQQTSQTAGNTARQKAAGQQTEKKSKLATKSEQQRTTAQSRDVRLARGGSLQQSKVMAQAESFHSMLDSKKSEGEGAIKGQAKEANESRGATKEAASERIADFEQKTEERRELAKQEARLTAAEKGKAGAAIDTDVSTGDDDANQNQNDEAGVDSAKRAAGKSDVKTETLQGAAGAKKLPPEVVEALVKQVLIGVTQDGDATFHIELNDGVLQGASLQITAKGGKIGIDVSGLDKNAKRLVQASVGQLQRGLESRGLALDWLNVE